MEYGGIISCANCDKRLSRVLNVLSQDEWAEWASRFSGLVDYNSYGAMPLVPFGAFTRFDVLTLPISWGSKAILEPGAFAGADPSSVLFLAPYELLLTLESYTTDCCGPSAYATSQDFEHDENLTCDCGARIGWIEETCFRHVNFTRIWEERVTVTEAPVVWPPEFTAGQFDTELFELVRQSQMSLALSDAWKFWEILQLLDQSCTFECESHYWTNIDPKTAAVSNEIRIYAGSPRQQTKPNLAEPERVIDVSTWLEHLRLAAAIAMQTNE